MYGSNHHRLPLLTQLVCLRWSILQQTAPNHLIGSSPVGRTSLSGFMSLVISEIQFYIAPVQPKRRLQIHCCYNSHILHASESLMFELHGLTDQQNSTVSRSSSSCAAMCLKLWWFLGNGPSLPVFPSPCVEVAGEYGGDPKQPAGQSSPAKTSSAMETKQASVWPTTCPKNMAHM